MKPRITYEIFVGETPKGQPLFKLYMLTEHEYDVEHTCIYEDEDRDKVDEFLRKQ